MAGLSGCCSPSNTEKVQKTPGHAGRPGEYPLPTTPEALLLSISFERLLRVWILI